MLHCLLKFESQVCCFELLFHVYMPFMSDEVKKLENNYTFLPSTKIKYLCKKIK